MLAGVSGHSVIAGSGDVYGGIFQAGRDVVLNAAPSAPPSATYEAVPKWRSPFTQGVLSWLGLVLGLVGVFPLWKVLRPVFQLFRMGLDLSEPRGGQHWWFWVFIAIFLMFVSVMSLRRLTKFQLRRPLFLGWALSGVGRRITLEKIRTGACPQCGGKMRYYNKPTEWTDSVDANGKRRREVTERVPALECGRNPKHWYEVDPAENAEA
ncbi:hypothetical protein I6B53_03680 [Schaalia sp. 19OD2882]|uniref:hypothetical protein n=1 Tax=Schaalia sp. 19OD2882 TaxID=2794089 RepID=UPI001C1EC82D|nr:hypothetical protein [Schaalia sp. 19OD2882]QWW20208.1 hypothetical protein I6B53_03680 [Schaalia sp. 19OD2882]